MAWEKVKPNYFREGDPIWFTDINVPFSVTPDDKRTDVEVLEGLKELGIKVTHHSEKPPEAFQGKFH